VKRVIHAMGDAISTTFDDVSQEIQGRLPKRPNESVAAPEQKRSPS
jgi:hypothetical protein